MDRLRLLAYETINPEEPWLTAAATQMLSGTIRKEHIGIEWGAGRSTIWLAERVTHLVTVEDDAAWYKRAQDRLRARQLSDRVDLRLLTAGGPASPYVLIAQEFATAHFDFALVDGRDREHCVLTVLPKLKPGGILVVDNVDRYLPSSRSGRRPPGALSRDAEPASAAWKAVRDALRTWDCVWTSNGVFDTAIWFKPR